MATIGGHSKLVKNLVHTVLLVAAFMDSSTPWSRNSLQASRSTPFYSAPIRLLSLELLSLPRTTALGILLRIEKSLGLGYRAAGGKYACRLRRMSSFSVPFSLTQTTDLLQLICGASIRQPLRDIKGGMTQRRSYILCMKKWLSPLGT